MTRPGKVRYVIQPSTHEMKWKIFGIDQEDDFRFVVCAIRHNIINDLERLRLCIAKASLDVSEKSFESYLQCINDRPIKRARTNVDVSNDGRRRNPFDPQFLQQHHFTCDDIVILYLYCVLLYSLLYRRGTFSFCLQNAQHEFRIKLLLP